MSTWDIHFSPLNVLWAQTLNSVKSQVPQANQAKRRFHGRKKSP